jgi:hypothetical protein
LLTEQFATTALYLCSGEAYRTRRWLFQLSFIVDQHVLIINSSLFHLLLVLGDLFVFLCLLEAFFLDSLSSFSVKFDSFSFVSVMSKLSLEILLLNHEPVVLLLFELKTVMREHMLK